MLLYNQDVALARWAGVKLGIDDWGPVRCIGVLRNFQIAGVAVFHQYRHPNIEISFVTQDPRWATRQNIAGILRYPFVTLGCKRLTAITGAKNQRARAFLSRLGFQQEGIHPDTFDSDDAVSYGLLRKDVAQWLIGAERAMIELGS